jgi:hypothetical protein
MNKRQRKKKYKKFIELKVFERKLKNWFFVDPLKDCHIQYSSAVRGAHPFAPFCDDIIRRIEIENGFIRVSEVASK